MKKKTLVICQPIILSLFIISCSSNSSPIPALFHTPSLVTPSSTISATSIQEATPIPLTAIPIADSNNKDELEKIIVDAFDGILKCYHPILKFENERKEAGDPIFREAEAEFTLPSSKNQRIAENENKTREAFDVYGPDEFLGYDADHVIVRDKTLNKIYDIEFYGHSGGRPIYSITWIGNDIIAFWQSNSPATDTVVGINVETKKYAYLAIYFRQCK